MTAGVIGPLVFIVDWAVLGATAAHYSPVNDAISRLAKTGAPTRAAMTVGFLVYGSALVAFAAAPRLRLPTPSRLLIAGTGLSTFGVAAFSLNALGQGGTHAIFAGIGYATLAAAPLVAAGSARDSANDRTWALSSAAAGLLTAAFLITSVFGPVHGLLQRIGLTAGDVWVMAAAVRAFRAWDR